MASSHVSLQVPHMLNVDMKNILPAPTYDEAPSPSPGYQRQGKIGFAADAPAKGQQPSRLAAASAVS